MVLISIIFFLGLSFSSLALSAAKNGITPTPSSKQAIQSMLAYVPADAELIYELGCGFGGLGLAAAKAFPEAKVIGLENSFFPFVVAHFRQKISRVKNLKIIKRDFYVADFNALADIPKESYEDIVMHLQEEIPRKKPQKIFLAYLCTSAMEKLKPKLKKELKEKNLLISNFFKVHGWKELPAEEMGVDLGLGQTKHAPLSKDIFVYSSKSVLEPFSSSHSMMASDS